MEARSTGSPREVLADAVRERLGIDIAPVWHWLQTWRWLPADLPDDWDPIGGENGALYHLDACKIPPAHPVSTDDAEESRGSTDDRPEPAATGPHGSCKLCAVMRVVLHCWTSTRPRNTAYMEKFADELAKLMADCAALTGRYSELMEKFGKERADHFRAELQGMIDSTPHEEARKALAAMSNAPTGYTALRVGNPAGVRSSLTQAMRGLAVLRDEVLSEARNDGRPDYRLAGKGRQTEPLTALWRLLKDVGFTYREISQILPDGRPQDGARERVIDRLKEEKRARAG